MDLPGRPGGDVDALRAAARAWEHLAWQIWQLSRPLENEADALAAAWFGAAADAYGDAWQPVRRGFYELDGRLHDMAGRLRGAADIIEGGQTAYDRALAAAGIVAAAGLGLTLLTAGVSDVVAAETETGIAATVSAIVVDMEAGMARLAAAVAEMSEALSGLATRFAVNFALRAPEFAYGPIGGATIGVGLTLASGDHDLGDLAASGLGGAAENVGATRRGPIEDERESGPASPLRTASADPVTEAWRGSLSPVQLAKQAGYDRVASARAADFSTIDEPLTPEVARAIDAQMPGSVRYVGRDVVDPASHIGDPLTDLDIETEKVIIQVKSGRTRGLSEQIDRSGAVSGKTVVGYAPAMSPDRLA